jgi:hypothetical protein
MIRTNNEVDNNLLEAEYFAKDIKLSYSSLNKLMNAPSIFYKEYILKDREDSIAKYLLEGILIHYLVLDGLDFDSKFILMPDSLPSENSVSIIKDVYKIYQEEDNAGATLDDYGPAVLQILTDKNLHSRIKDDTKRIAKVVDQNGRDYFEFLKKQNGRTIIDSKLLDKCTKRAEIIKGNDKIREVLGLDLIHDGTKIGVYNEIELDGPCDATIVFGLKGIIDNLVVDVVNQVVTINDFKTTSRMLEKFPESVENYRYWLQACIYMKLVHHFLSDVPINKWTFKFNFIVFDRYDQLYTFPVSSSTLSEWNKRTDEVLKAAVYHLTEKEFDLPFKFAKDLVSL